MERQDINPIKKNNDKYTCIAPSVCTALYEGNKIRTVPAPRNLQSTIQQVEQQRKRKREEARLKSNIYVIE